MSIPLYPIVVHERASRKARCVTCGEPTNLRADGEPFCEKHAPHRKAPCAFECGAKTSMAYFPPSGEMMIPCCEKCASEHKVREIKKTPAAMATKRAS